MRVADVFKIGIGPSSSHTVGPMRAARAFALDLAARVDGVARLRVDLFGSLALTGRGHGTDRASVLGLAGETPVAVDVDRALSLPARVAECGRLPLASGEAVAFVPAEDIVFHPDETLPRHPNGMRFTAWNTAGAIVAQAEYCSVGGGAVEGPGFAPATEREEIPYPFVSAADLLALADAAGIAIWELVRANEHALEPPAALASALERIWTTMRECAERGLRTEGILPGGLNVRRRAPRLYRAYRERAAGDHLDAMDFVNVVAIAVNEENAAGGRVVTAPTNGAAGIIPAVLRYYQFG
jgi:L-serine dehydratase